MNREEKLKLITEYIKSGEKDPEDWTIGVEMEHFVVEKDTGKTVSYYGENGVGETLDEIGTMLGAEKEIEDDHVLGLSKDYFDIATEPGSQFEIAVKSNCCIDILEKRYKDFFKKVLPVFEEKNQALLTVGYHPVTKIDEIKILPKKRYDYMYNYFKERGSMAHNMMKGTASLQVTLDYRDEEDFRKKFRIMNALAPVFYALFDNSYIFEGEVSPIRNIRQKIWDNTDSDRSGVYDFAFDEDLSYETYAERILDTPMIFQDDGKDQIYVGSKTLEDLLTEENKDFMLDHGVSIVFPDVRVKTYIEVRMMDAIPYPLNFSCVALIKGLMYHEENLEILSGLVKDCNYEVMTQGRKDVEKKGLEAEYLGMTILEWGYKLLKLAKNALPVEKKYLIFLQDLLEEGLTPRDHFEKVYKEEGLLEAIRMNEMDPRNFRC